MINKEQDHELLRAQGDGHLVPASTGPAPPSGTAPARRRMGFGQRVVVAVLLTVVVVPPAAGIFSYVSGVPLHLLTSSKGKDDVAPASAAGSSITLVADRAHTLEVPEDVCKSLGIRKGGRDAVAVARVPAAMRPLVLSGSTDFDPARVARVRARFAPARVVQIAQVWDQSPETGHTKYRELRQGDRVATGDLLGVFYSVDVGAKKSDLLNALVQLELDQKNLDEALKHAEAIPPILLRSYEATVRQDRNAIHTALSHLELWDIPRDEIDALHDEAKKISADKNAWSKTREGRWVRGERLAKVDKDNHQHEGENPWGRVSLYAPFGGVIVEQNVAKGETVVDNTVNLFQIADVSRLQVKVHCPEDELPSLEALQGAARRWTVRTAHAPNGLPGTIDVIGAIIDPNQHTALIKGYVENPGNRIPAGEFASATVDIPPPAGVVEIPTDALVDDGRQGLVFVQAEAGARRFTMRRVRVTHRFDRTVFVRSTPIPEAERLTDQEAEEGLLPQEPLRPGERVLVAGSVELKAVVADLESRPQAGPVDDVGGAKVRPVSHVDPQPARASEAVDGGEVKLGPGL